MVERVVGRDDGGKSTCSGWGGVVMERVVGKGDDQWRVTCTCSGVSS